MTGKARETAGSHKLSGVRARASRSRKRVLSSWLGGSRFCLFVESRSDQVELINHAFVAHDVDFATFIGRERSNALRRRANLSNDLKRAVTLLQPEDAMRRVIAANVNAVERRVRVAAIDVA